MKSAGRKHQAPDKSLLAVGLVLCLGTVSAAKPHTFGETQASDGYAVALVIAVRIYNYARVPTPILVSAEGEAQKIFRQAGVETEWLDCRLPAAEPRTSACRRPLTTSDLILRLLPTSMAQTIAVQNNEVFGMAL
ncbi:MAG: hypothetical protein DMG27_23225, partial [Acidobacteria bacterium]